jgi:hypothetical protein
VKAQLEGGARKPETGALLSTPSGWQRTRGNGGSSTRAAVVNCFACLQAVIASALRWLATELGHFRHAGYVLDEPAGVRACVSCQNPAALISRISAATT